MDVLTVTSARKAFGSVKAAQILKRIQGQLDDSDRFKRLRRADPQQLGNTLRGEHPQTIALILAHLAAALMHGLIRRDGVFRSMTTGHPRSPAMTPECGSSNDRSLT
jgi:hypothetical protein